MKITKKDDEGGVSLKSQDQKPNEDHTRTHTRRMLVRMPIKSQVRDTQQISKSSLRRRHREVMLRPKVTAHFAQKKDSILEMYAGLQE